MEQPDRVLSDRPKGLLLALLRAPGILYSLGLGRVLGHRFLALTHRGRRSGRLRETVIEVIQFDPHTREAIVVSAWGERTDWYRNLRASPAATVRIGGHRYAPKVRFLTEGETLAAVEGYAARNRLLLRLVGDRLFGLRLGTDEGRRAFAARVRGVAFVPAEGAAGTGGQQGAPRYRDDVGEAVQRNDPTGRGAMT